MTSPFDFINSVSFSKEYLLETELDEKDYSSWMVNKGLSYFPDTILFSNEMNIYHNTPTRMQYDFFFHGLRKRKRFSKWSKNKVSKDVELVAKLYNINYKRAEEILPLITEEKLKELRTNRDDK